MTTNDLINLANIQADKRADCFTDDCIIGSELYEKAVEKMHTIPSFAEYKDIICESTKCFKGNTVYYSNRFYILKPDGNRSTFSKAKAIIAIG